jgi:outer membrane lipoprotein SlyB
MNYKLRKERDMKKLLIGVAVAAMMMTPVAAKAGDNWIGPIIGGGAGGILGNQIGGGSGKTAATAIGAVIGALVGQELSRQNNNNNTSTATTTNNRTVVVQENRREYRVRREGRRYQRNYELVEVCKRYPILTQDEWGDYYTIMRGECRVVRRAIW